MADKTVSPPAGALLHRVTNRGLGIMVESTYVPDGDSRWRVTHWRLFTSTHGWGAWYKVRGNQKRPIAGLPVLTYAPPVACCPLTAEEVARAAQRR